MFQSLLVMPLSLLETVLPWLHAHLSPDEAAQVIENMSMAGEYTFARPPLPPSLSRPLLLSPSLGCKPIMAGECTLRLLRLLTHNNENMSVWSKNTPEGGRRRRGRM